MQTGQRSGPTLQLSPPDFLGYYSRNSSASFRHCSDGLWKVMISGLSWFPFVCFMVVYKQILILELEKVNKCNE